MQASLERRIHEFHVLRKENKQNSFRKTQMEKKINDVEQIASEMTKQKAEFLQYKENAEKKTTETLLILNNENESVRSTTFFYTSRVKLEHKFNQSDLFISDANRN